LAVSLTFLNTGKAANDTTGTLLQAGGQIINANFLAIQTAINSLGGGSFAVAAEDFTTSSLSTGNLDNPVTLTLPALAATQRFRFNAAITLTGTTNGESANLYWTVTDHSSNLGTLPTVTAADFKAGSSSLGGYGSFITVLQNLNSQSSQGAFAMGTGSFPANNGGFATAAQYTGAASSSISLDLSRPSTAALYVDLTNFSSGTCSYIFSFVEQF
jgi:hypothetical protein